MPFCGGTDIYYSNNNYIIDANYDDNYSYVNTYDSGCRASWLSCSSILS
ncbi:MAG: hypothetical protein ACREOY_08490 [Candidatus Dormibacteraceae bacterium]